MRLFLYDEPATTVLDVEALATWLRATFVGVPVVVRQAFHRHASPLPDVCQAGPWLDDLARRWAEAKVLDPDRPVAPREPLYGELTYERRRLADPHSRSFGIVYDGLLVQDAFRHMLPPGERRLTDVHLVFTRQLIATHANDDLRYHLHILIGGPPSLLSTTGLAHAPARSREYYVAQAVRRSLGDAHAGELSSATDEQFMETDDPRTTEVLKGYALQAIVYQLTGEAFCQDVNCRLFDAHWQEELIRAQLGDGPELCRRHETLLATL